MFQNFFRTTWRNLLRYKTFSSINVFGLAISMSVCLLAILLIVDAYKYDRFHSDSDQIYRILTDAIRKSGGQEGYATSPYPAGEALQAQFTGLESWVPLVRGLSGSFKAGDKELFLSGLYTNPSFFDVFSFELEKGDVLTALSQPNTLVLTPETAIRFFGDSNPIGKTLGNAAIGEFTVTGIVKPAEGKTHLEFEALASLATLPSIEARSEGMPIMENWNNYYSTYNFVKLKPQIDKADAEATLAQIATSAFEGRVLETRDAGYEYRLQPLTEITPGPILSNSMGRGLPEFMIWFLSGLCLIVMTSACFNYASLTIARAFTRNREIGIRKVLGAHSRQIFLQFMGEAVLIASLAFIFAYGLLELTIPYFESLSFMAFTDVNLELDAGILLRYMTLVVAVGCIAGLLPAIVFSRSTASAALRQLSNSAIFRRMGFRKVLLVAQFSVSLLFVIVLTIQFKQTDYAIQGNFGADKSDILNVMLDDLGYDKVVAELQQIPQISEMSATSHLMGTWQDRTSDFRLSETGDVFRVRDYFIDDRFLDNLDIKIVAGENFESNPTQSEELSIIVNEKFLETHQIASAAEALNTTILIEGGPEVRIRAVLEDFLYKPLNYSLEPLVLRYDPSQWRVLNLKVTGDAREVTSRIDAIWQKLGEQESPRYAFYSDEVSTNFANIQDLMWIVAYFSTIGIIIACLGLLGMAIYTAEARSKEISIRRVVGADTKSLIVLLAKGYAILLLVAVIIAVPVGYLLGGQILQMFAYHINLDASVFLPGILLVFLLGALTTGSQIIRSALANPIETLRYQ